MPQSSMTGRGCGRVAIMVRTVRPLLAPGAAFGGPGDRRSCSRRSLQGS
jgi:hypothetical protein